MELKIRELLLELIKFKTVEKNLDELRNIIEFCHSYLKANGFLKFDIFEVNGKWNLIADYGVDVSVYFVVHLDVVDAYSHQFEPIVDDGKVIGRGALDMKGPGSVVIELFKNLSNNRYPIGLILTTDEEVGSHNGVKYIVEKKKIGAKLVIIPDGGENFKIITKGKGALHFVVKAKGKSAHGSTPWNGVNAIDCIIDFYQDLRRNILFNESLDSINHWHNTINLGRIEGGQKVNIVPSEAYAHIDIRFIEKYSLEEIINVVSYFSKKYGLDLEILSTGQPVVTDIDSVYFRKFLDSYTKVIGEPVFDVEHGATDGRFFASLGIPVITIYPVGGGIHSDYEWVDLQSLYKLYDIFYYFVLDLI
ncbi:MAG: M20/M25/M40 family metallo-hydrolase [Candidatus Calescibacterium sp.]|nr:M20/M25/M40 family metallo-hydrolase [Candidatus Calescibacterium sp.]MDW8132743.1 M20/M25/M40 family metallo-hydrolase [Candidatus Calescibacterium sp.]